MTNVPTDPAALASAPFPRPALREHALRHGTASLGDAELLALLLGTGTASAPAPVLAANLLAETGGLARLASFGVDRLAEHDGVGPVKALRLAGAFELGRRAVERASEPRRPLRTSAEVADFLAPRVAMLDHEEMWLLALDGRNHLRACRRVSQGGLHACAVCARDLLRIALAEAASAIVLAHNHPSGDPTPSREDIALTRTVSDAAHVVGVPLVDHVVLAPGGRYTSMLALGALDGA